MAYVEGEAVARSNSEPMLRSVQMLSVLPPKRAIWGCVVEATDSFHLGEVVAIPREPVKKESLVEVEIKEPTVNCDVVAMRVVPAESLVMIEFPANVVEFVPPFETGSVPEMLDRVVVATHVGRPLTKARVKPFVVFEIDDRLSAVVV